MSEKQLFNNFKSVSTEQWEEKIKQDLKGADYDKKLITETHDGINIKPYYREENLKTLNYLQKKPGEFPFVRGTKRETNNFDIRQDIFVEEYAETNRKIKHATEKGADSIGLFICHKKEINENEITALLKDINPETTVLNFISGKISLQTLKLFINFCDKNNFNPKKIKASFDFDPFGYKTITGNSYTPNNLEKDFTILKEMLEIVSEKFPLIKIVSINGIFFSNAGALSSQELAFSLASANELLAKSEEAGIEIKEIIPKIMFTFGIGSNYFIEIAKLRAARLLWAKITESWTKNKNTGITFINSVTSSFNKTLYDPYVNQLRNTTEAGSAIIGGTDSLTVNPFDSIYKKPNEFSERIARNTGIILKEEAYFDKAIDPSGGSYYIENLTNDIAEKAWQLFLEIEEKGGYNKALQEKLIQNKIKETANKRDADIANRKEILLGTNQYPNFSEKIIDTEDLNIWSWSLPANEKIETEPIKMYRGAKAFEELRIQVEKSRKQPKVFLLTYGNLTMRKARASFATGFFACAGYEIINNKGFEDINSGVNEALSKNADIVVFCSSDDEYPKITPETADKLKGKAVTVIAGYPKNNITELKAKGIEYFIHVKSNVLETLQKFNELLKIN